MSSGEHSADLPEQLGMKRGMRVFIADMPDTVRQALPLDQLGLELLAAPSVGIDAAYVFAATRDRLAEQVNALRQLIAPSGFIWVSWPEGNGALNRDLVRDIAEPQELVIVQSCTIDPIWSALKLMHRKERA